MEIGVFQYLFNLRRIVRFYYCFVLAVKAWLTSTQNINNKMMCASVTCSPVKVA